MWQYLSYHTAWTLWKGCVAERILEKCLAIQSLESWSCSATGKQSKVKLLHTKNSISVQPFGVTASLQNFFLLIIYRNILVGVAKPPQ